MNTILRKQFLAHVGQTSPSPMLVEVERAEGSFFYTPEGRRYYDLVAGVSVSNVGHANAAVVRAVQEQAALEDHGAAERARRGGGGWQSGSRRRCGCRTGPALRLCLTACPHGRRTP